MNIKWSDEALESYDETLNYWVHHNNLTVILIK